MINLRRLFAAVLTFAFFAACSAEISAEPSTLTVLLNYGSAEGMVTVISKMGGEPSVSESSLYSVDSITPEAGDGYTNYTIRLSMEDRVGRDDMTVTIGEERVTVVVICAGFVISENGKVVSGDNNEGVSVGPQGSFRYDVTAVGTDGGSVDISGTRISPAAKSGSYKDEVDQSATTISSSSFTLVMSRAGSGAIIINFETSSISLSGETFETVLNVRQDTSTSRCVAVGGTYTVTDNQVSVPMINTLDKTSITIAAGGQSGSWDREASTSTTPRQTIVFDFDGSGTATIECDGVEATTQGGDVVIRSSEGEVSLAKDNVNETPETEDGKDQIIISIRLVSSSVDTLTTQEAEDVTAQCCTVISGSRCAFTAITAGSAVVKVVGNAENGPEKESAIKDSVEKCEFQKAIGRECPDVQVSDYTVNVVGGAGAAAGAAGLATWTIVLIAALGAFALIVLIMLGLLAVYRRSAEQSESDYSSSGPLGVPDPSDLLYEQSIVRDIYGRGDFPEGGPSRAVAEQREREAALREEYPRPPSSSGLSRGSATDDASSTYSV